MSEIKSRVPRLVDVDFLLMSPFAAKSQARSKPTLLR
jgi:hypothetical protein